MRLEIQPEGVALLGEKVRTLSLEPGESQAVRFQLEAKQPGSARLRFLAQLSGGGARPTYRDAVELKRNVALPALVETVAIEGDTEAGVIEKLAALKGIRKDAGGLEITVGTSPLERLAGGIESLFEYPYGCLEQTSSKLVPLIAAKELIDALGVTVVHQLKPDVRTVAQAGVDRIHTFAQEDGGFGLWPEARETSPYYTAIGLWTLEQARRAGYRVDDNVIKRGLEYLKKNLGKQDKSSEIASYYLAARAFILRVMAELGQADLGRINELYERRDKLPTFAQADLMVALHAGKGDHRAILELKKMILGQASPRPGGVLRYIGTEPAYGGLFASDARTTAAVAEAIAIVDRNEPKLGPLVKGILSLRKGGAWRNTQENGYIVRALWRVLGKELSEKTDLDAVVTLGGKEVLKASLLGKQFQAARVFIPMATLFADGAGDRERELVFERRGKGRIYYTARLRYVRKPVPRVGRDAPLHVERKYEMVRLVDGEPQATPGTEVQAGQLVRVSLTVVSPNDEQFIAIEDPVPAGLEVVNFGLTNVSPSWRKLLGEGAEGQEDGPGYPRFGRGQWYSYRELRDDKVLIFADSLVGGVYHFTYLCKAITPGRFTVAPLYAEAMYSPEVSGRSGASGYTVNKGE